MEKLNVLSLFDGISCGRLALELEEIGIKNYFRSEIDPDADLIAIKNFPNSINLGGVESVFGKDLPKIDLLIGGSPCQSFSRQGNQSGFDGKSGLFWEFIRIKNETNPKYFLLENVEMRKEWRDIISEAIGVEPIFINSGDVSPQKRRRLYWTNIPFLLEKKEVKLCEILDINETEGFDPKFEDLVMGDLGAFQLKIKNATSKGFLIAKPWDGISLQFPKSTTRRGRVQGGKICTLDTSCEVGVNIKGRIRRLNVNELERCQGLPTHYTIGIPERKRKKAIGNGWQVDTIRQIFKGLKTC